MTAKSSLLPIFANKVLLEPSYTNYLQIIENCFWTTMAELNTWDRNYMARRAKNIYPTLPN